MDAGEDTSLEAAIAWLVQTILATLLMDKLEEWIRQVGLSDDVEKLKSEIRRVGMAVSAVKGRANGNEPLAQSLVKLRELLYEADDVVDDLDYYRLQQQVEGVRRDKAKGMHGVERGDEISRGDVDTPNSSVGKLRSLVWEHFNITEKDNGKPVKSVCKYCDKEFRCETKNGTSSMSKHINKICKMKPRPPNISSTDDAIGNAAPVVISDSCSRKRRRMDQDSAQIIASSTQTPWDKDIISNRIQKNSSQLQDIRGDVGEFLELHRSDIASSSNNHRSTALDQHIRTSSLVPGKVYGRVAEKDSIIKMITEDKSDNITVVPIVGIAGVGKTALAQLVYNDPDVKTEFHYRIWVWVSHNFDKLRITTEMLNFVSRERHAGYTREIESHEGIRSFVNLQEILKEHMEYQPRKFLLILDDVWDNFDDYRWNELLAPLISGDVIGNVILVTTRNFSVAQKIGSVKPVKLGALANDDFWLLFESHAFGDKNCGRRQSLSIVGRQIAEKLKGNPLAAETAGALLRKHLNVDRWNGILMNEDWKSLQLCRGIMSALKLSYDQLPYHLQECFSFCSIFPDSYEFLGKKLVHIWISLGFVRSNHSSKRLEEIGQFYLTDLVNLGFIQQVGEEEEESSLTSQSSYSICGLMHDFARMVSRNYCATIDGLKCSKVFPTIQHLAVLTDSAYSKDQIGHIPRNNKFEEKLRKTVISVRKLRSLVLIGKYDSNFFQVFQDKFRLAHNLRLLQMSATSADFYSLLCSLVDATHLRYIQRNGAYSSIANIGSMTSLQELHDFKVQSLSAGFEISQLQSMNELVELGLSQLDCVKTREGANQAQLRDKVHLEKLHLSWKDTSPQELLPMDGSSPSSEPTTEIAEEVLQGLEPHMDLKHLHISGYNGTISPTWLSSNISLTSLQTLHLNDCGEWRILPSLESLPFLTMLKLTSMQHVTEVLVPSLEELVLIKMPELLRCSSTSVEGLNCSLRVLQIVNCEVLKEFDLFENNGRFEIEQSSWLPGLRKLTLWNCPRLEVLNPLPPSATCFELLIDGVSTFPSMEGSSNEELCIGDEDFHECSDELRILDDKILAFRNLRNLKSMSIQGCRNLSSFSLEGFSQLVSLKSLKISMCWELFSSDVTSEHTTEDVTTGNWKAFPSLQCLSIRSCGIEGKWLSLLLRHAPHLEELKVVEEEEDSSSGEEDDALNGLAQYGLVHMPLDPMPSLKKIIIQDCRYLTFNCSEEEGFSGFTSLQELSIWGCPELFSSLVHKHGNDDQANGTLLLPTSLEELSIGRWSQETLRPCFPPSDLTNLKRLTVQWAPNLESLQLRSCTALEELTITCCGQLTALEGLQSLVRLRHLAVSNCPGLGPCLESSSRQGYELFPRLETLEISDPSVLTTSFCNHLISLRRLNLKSLVLTEDQGRALVLLKSLQSLVSLRHLTVNDCPGLGPCLESSSRQGCELLPRLESLEINDPSVLTTSFCNHLTSLRCLTLLYLVLTEEQGRALVLLTSLQELEFHYCYNLVVLPAELHLLPSLKRLELFSCSGISRLPETGLPLSLEQLEILYCSEKLTNQCRALATSKLRVKINGSWLV